MLTQRLLKIVSAIEANGVFSSIKKGLILLMPVLITGAVALMLRSFPVDVFQAWLQSSSGVLTYKILSFLYDSTFGFLSAFLVLSISYYYSSTFRIKNFSLQILAMIVSLVCFIASFGGASGSLELSHFGPQGVFTAMVSAIIATKLFYVLCEQFYKLFHFHVVAADVDYRNSLIAILPLVICVMAFIAMNLLINALFGVSNFNDLISKGLVSLFANINGGLAGGILFVFMLNLLWFFGIHGGNAIDQVAQAVFVPANTSGTEIVSKTFLDNFALIGGCGAAICLLLALLIASRTKDNRRLAGIAAPTVLFNINEILVFGLPVVLNPIMLIPFVLIPVCSLLIAYVSTVLGIIPITTTAVTWTTPVFLSGYLATGSVWGVVVQGVIIAAGTLIYIPFVRLSERLQTAREKMIGAKMTEKYKRCLREGDPCTFLGKNDDMGMIAKAMVNCLRSDVARDQVAVYYQPQMDTQNHVVGAEALLRWSCMQELVFPPLVISLAQEDGFYGELTAYILKKVCSEIKVLKGKLCEDIEISVNITAEQLNDVHFVQRVIQMVKAEGVGGNLCLEITEESSLVYLDKIPQNIEMLKKNKISIAIDDFSMGQTSLKYLQTSGFDYVKLDGELVKQVIQNTRSKEIVESIVWLGRKLGFLVIAEYVETETVRKLLQELGCSCFQGYLFSPAIPFEEFAAYFIQNEQRSY